MRVLVPRFIVALMVGSALAFLVATALLAFVPGVTARLLKVLLAGVAATAIVRFAATWPREDWWRATVVNVSAGLYLGIVGALGGLYSVAWLRGARPRLPDNTGALLRSLAVALPIVIAFSAVPLGLASRRLSREPRAGGRREFTPPAA